MDLKFTPNQFSTVGRLEGEELKTLARPKRPQNEASRHKPQVIGKLAIGPLYCIIVIVVISTLAPLSLSPATAALQVAAQEQQFINQSSPTHQLVAANHPSQLFLPNAEPLLVGPLLKGPHAVKRPEEEDGFIMQARNEFASPPQASMAAATSEATETAPTTTAATTMTSKGASANTEADGETATPEQQPQTTIHPSDSIPIDRRQFRTLAPEENQLTTTTTSAHQSMESTNESGIPIDANRRQYLTHDQLSLPDASTKDENINLSAGEDPQANQGGQTSSQAGMSKVAYMSTFLSDLFEYATRAKSPDEEEESSQRTPASGNSSPLAAAPDSRVGQARPPQPQPQAQLDTCPGVCRSIITAPILCRNEISAPCPSFLQKCCDKDDVSFNGTPVETSAPLAAPDSEDNVPASQESGPDHNQAAQAPPTISPVAAGGHQTNPGHGNGSHIEPRVPTTEQPEEPGPVYFLSSSGGGGGGGGGSSRADQPDEQAPAPHSGPTDAQLAQPASGARSKPAASQSFDSPLEASQAASSPLDLEALMGAGEQSKCAGYCTLPLFTMLCDSTYESADCSANKKCCVIGAPTTTNPTLLGGSIGSQPLEPAQSQPRPTLQLNSVATPANTRRQNQAPGGALSKSHLISGFAIPLVSEWLQQRQQSYLNSQTQQPQPQPPPPPPPTTQQQYGQYPGQSLFYIVNDPSKQPTNKLDQVQAPTIVAPMWRPPQQLNWVRQHQQPQQQTFLQAPQFLQTTSPSAVMPAGKQQFVPTQVQHHQQLVPVQQASFHHHHHPAAATQPQRLNQEQVMVNEKSPAVAQQVGDPNAALLAYVNRPSVNLNSNNQQQDQLFLAQSQMRPTLQLNVMANNGNTRRQPQQQQQLSGLAHPLASKWQQQQQQQQQQPQQQQRPQAQYHPNIPVSSQFQQQHGQYPGQQLLFVANDASKPANKLDQMPTTVAANQVPVWRHPPQSQLQHDQRNQPLGGGQQPLETVLEQPTKRTPANGNRVSIEHNRSPIASAEPHVSVGHDAGSAGQPVVFRPIEAALVGNNRQSALIGQKGSPDQSGRQQQQVAASSTTGANNRQQTTKSHSRPPVDDAIAQQQQQQPSKQQASSLAPSSSNVNTMLSNGPFVDLQRVDSNRISAAGSRRKVAANAPSATNTIGHLDPIMTPPTTTTTSLGLDDSHQAHSSSGSLCSSACLAPFVSFNCVHPNYIDGTLACSAPGALCCVKGQLSSSGATTTGDTTSVAPKSDLLQPPAPSTQAPSAVVVDTNKLDPAPVMAESQEQPKEADEAQLPHQSQSPPPPPLADVSSASTNGNTLELSTNYNSDELSGALVSTKIQNTACGLPGPKRRASSGQARARVMGGFDAQPGFWCWQAALMNNKNEYLCGGALIGAKWVLTAAHCVTQHLRSESPLFVRLGQTNLNSSSLASDRRAKTIQVKTSYVHHNHNGITLDNDIALLRLEEAADLSGPSICLVCLPERSSKMEAGKRCTVTGYGFEAESGPAALRVRQTELPIVSERECQNKTSVALGKPFSLPASSFCAGGELGQDACHGDGGSPLSCLVDGYYELAGIVSWGYKCGSKDLPGLYSKVSAFVGWINQIVSVNN